MVVVINAGHRPAECFGPFATMAEARAWEASQDVDHRSWSVVEVTAPTPVEVESEP